MLQLPLNNIFSFKNQSSVLLWFFLLLIFTACSENDISEIKSLPRDRTKTPVSVSKNLQLSLSDSAIIKIKIQAPQLERYDNATPPYSLMPNGIHIAFIDSAGNTEATVDAEHGKHYQESQVLELSHNVRIVNKQGDKLNSEHVTWNANTHKISSKDFVKITTEDQIIYGDGFIANEDFTDYQINHVKGIVAIDEDGEDALENQSPPTPKNNEDL